MEDYLNKTTRELKLRNYSPKTIKAYLFCIELYLNYKKFFYSQILKIYKKIDIKFAKRNKNLPIVLSREEIKKILKNTINKKHRLMITLAYGSGLRVSEI